MKIFDFNIHLPDTSDIGGVNEKVHSEIVASGGDLIGRVSKLDFLKDIAGANFMVFNSSLVLKEENFVIEVRKHVPLSAFTLLVDFRSPDGFKQIEAAHAQGFSCIKFHSYHQNIRKEDYPAILALCKHAEARGLSICLDGSYGTSFMIENDIIEFICCVSRNISKVPVIVLHSGGLKCMEIFLLAMERKNIYLEMSATQSIYEGSRIHEDLAFIYNKIGDRRILFASDSPYFEFGDSVRCAKKILDQSGFDDGAQKNIFFANATQILGLKA